MSASNAAGPRGHWALRLRDMCAECTAYPDIIDLGIGQPDGDPPEAVRRALATPPTTAHHYPAALGSGSLRAAISDWVGARFGLSYGPSEVVVTHGSKLAVALSTLAFAGPGGRVVVPDPGYPTYAQAARRIGAEVRWLHLSAPDFLPGEAELDAAFAGADMAFFNYPNNPTGAVADEATFDRLIAAARAHGTVLVHDAAYIDLVHEGRGLSLLSRPGADEVAVELHSLSKAFHLAGYRVGFALGRAPLLARLERVLAEMDTGASNLAQILAEVALREHPTFAEERRARDRRRTESMGQALRGMDCELTIPRASFYLWFRPPGPQLAWERIVREAGIACAPGEAFGPAGADWIRLSCVQPDLAYDEAIRRLSRLRLE